LVALVAGGVLLWLFPPFRIVPLERLQAEQLQDVFNAAASAEQFWTDRLGPRLNQSADAAVALPALSENASAAAQKYGRSVGLSSSAFFLLQGRGTVTAVDRKGVTVGLTNSEPPLTILLKTGLIFGNAVRDCTDLLDTSDFPDSQQFNDLSAELNRLVETRVIPLLKTNVVAGQPIHFVGVAEVDLESNPAMPWQLVPLRVSVESAAP
jgi:predicted lipoprotein